MKEKEKAPPRVSLSRLAKAYEGDQSDSKGAGTYPDGVHLVHQALLELGFITSAHEDSGRFDAQLVAAYAALQRHLGTHPAAATGAPGKDIQKYLADTTQLFATAA